MNEEQIVDLFWQRKEEAIKVTEEKYSRYCLSIAINILSSEEDAKECVNDMLLRAWNSIPPAKPSNLKSYLGKITRNLALDKYDHLNAQKRGSRNELVFDELSECIPDGSSDTGLVEQISLKKALNEFLGSLNEEKRIIFMQRYWYLSSVKEIATNLSISEGTVKITLLRLRAKFKKYLEKEGIKI